MTQYTLFNGNPPSVAHSETSQAAAESIKGKIGPLHARILRYLTNLRLVVDIGATDEEMQRALSMPPNTQRPRRRELQLMGRIVDSGIRRPTSSGRDAVVWKLA